MKKILFILIGLLIFTGCQSKGGDDLKLDEVKEDVKTPVDVEKNTELVSKKDNSKDWVYIIEDIGFPSYDLYELGKDSNPDQADFSKQSYLSSLGNQKDNKNRIYPVEKLVVNIDTEDGLKVEKELQGRFFDAWEVQAVNAEAVEKGEIGYQWSSIYLSDLYETEDVISFTVIEFLAVIPSDGVLTNYLTYTFDKQSGQLLNNDEILKKLGYTPEHVKNGVLRHFEDINKQTKQNVIDNKLTPKDVQHGWNPYYVLDTPGDLELDTNYYNIFSALTISDEATYLVKDNNTIFVGFDIYSEMFDEVVFTGYEEITLTK